MSHLQPVPDAALTDEERAQTEDEYATAYADLYLTRITPPDPSSPDSIRRWRESCQVKARELSRLEGLLND